MAAAAADDVYGFKDQTMIRVSTTGCICLYTQVPEPGD